MRLAEQLITLARSGPGVHSDAYEPINLAETTRLAAAGQVALSLSAPEPASVNGHAASLRILARYLADNAVRYTPRGGHVEIEVR